jgi:hypothetical protein
LKKNQIISILKQKNIMLVNKVKKMEQNLNRQKKYIIKLSNTINILNNTLKINKNNYNTNIYIRKIKELENSNNKISERRYFLEKENKKLHNEIDNQKITMNYYIKIINVLKHKNNNLENEKYDILSSNCFNCNKKIKENEELIKINNYYRKLIKLSNEKIKKFQIFLQKVKKIYENKLSEYKKKIVFLKIKIEQMHYEKNMERGRNSCDNINPNYNKGDNFLLTENSNNNNCNFAYNSSSQFYPRYNMNDIKSNNINPMTSNYKIVRMKKNKSYSKK